MLKEGGGDTIEWARETTIQPGREECTGVAPYGWPLYILPKNILIYLWRTYTMLLEYSI